jgi:hypothetical protein
MITVKELPGCFQVNANRNLAELLGKGHKQPLHI